MKGDFSRFTFDPAKQFTRVLAQQGRVQLDSDFNEQMEILWHYLRTLASDLIGPYGGPDSAELGFAILPKTVQGNERALEDLTIGFGRYYVDGILCQNVPQRVSPEGSRRASTAHIGHDFSEDEDVEGPGVHDEEMGKAVGGTLILPSKVDASGVTYYRQGGTTLSAEEARSRYGELPNSPFLVYLDVWERSVSAVEDPDIREVALGGVDTSARSQVVWQVRAASLEGIKEIEKIDCDRFATNEFTRNFWKELTNKVPPDRRGRLAAKAREPRAEESTDPCIISPEARYRRPENQLYRVEIHTGGTINSTPPPTFKFSRENASIEFPILSIKERAIALEHLGRDSRSGLQAGDWVEVVDEDYTPFGNLQPLLQVESVDPIGMTVTLKTPPRANSSGKRLLLRRWDQRAGDRNTGGLEINDDEKSINRDNAALIKAEWLNLEDGIQVSFEAERTYVAGDYWLIPARTATGDIVWPPGDKTLVPPQGVNHHYAPLAIVLFRAADPTRKEGFFVTDLRRRINPVAECLNPNQASIPK
jgi:hypothetical protein